ncbi:hypothetical protein ACFQ9Q_42435 [Streptomyces virginiae]|uniref:hypothetical protein n=1 Tax=Streptomyces virginiae TaxID=1961 RepID=UPI0036A26655
MNETVTVALITALATLAGGGMASLVAAWNTRKQLQSTHALAAIEKAEGQRRERRELRRDAYLKFIDQLSATDRAMVDLWQTNALTEQVNVRTYEPFKIASGHLNALVDRAHLVALEGPEDLHAAALQSAVDEARALAALGDLVHESVGREGDLGSLHSDIRNTQNEIRYRNTSNFIRAAQRVLHAEGG